MGTATGYAYKNYILLFGLAVLLSIILACSKGTDSNDKPPTPDSPGVLLEGDTNSTAAYATSAFLAKGSAAGFIDDSLGLLDSRLTAILNPAATVGTVNAALDSIGALIVAMGDSSLFLTLSVPAQSDRTSLESLCDQLVASGAFLAAFPAYAPLPPSDETTTELIAPTSIIPGEPASTRIDHLIDCRMPAAWNLQEYALSLGNKVSVLAPDVYSSLSVCVEIPSQRFVNVNNDSANLKMASGNYVGAHGYNVCGILGALYDDAGTTGIHPGYRSLIEIKSQSITNYDWAVMIQMIADSIPRTGKSIVNTSLGYNDPYFTKEPAIMRIAYALKWREFVSPFQDHFLHVAAAGNDADDTNGKGKYTLYSSPFTTAALMIDPSDLLDHDSTYTKDSTILSTIFDFYAPTKPWVFTPLTNTIIVGSSQYNGQPSDFSNLGADVRMIGEDIKGPCIQPDNRCINGTVEMSGTSQATPQIPGLAAYMMNLKPDAPLSTIREAIINSYDSAFGVVDAYNAVLALDVSSNKSIRTALLDVAGNSDSVGTNGKFDDHDIFVYLEAFERAAPLPPDDSRYDLNGNRMAGGSGKDKFDLTVSTPPVFGPVGVSFCTHDTILDENLLTDLSILQYYAYSDLYTGDINRRDSMFGCDDPVGKVVITWRWEMGRTIVESANYDSVLDVAGDSMSTPPPFPGISPGGSSSYPCSGDGEASATVTHSSSFSLIGPDTLTGFTYSASGEVIADGSCDVHPHVTTFVSISFDVVNAPVYFTLSLNGTWSGDSNCMSDCGSSGHLDYSDTGDEEVEYRFPDDGTSVQDNGMLVPGHHNISVGNGAGRTGSFDMSFTITFSSSAKKKHETNDSIKKPR